MTKNEAQIIGRTKTLKATGLIVAILLVVFMVLQTRGDFANGILFFMQAITNIHFIVIMSLLFGLTYVFGGFAGKEVILENKSSIWISFKYPVAIILSVIIYAAVVGIVKDNSPSMDNLRRLLFTYFLTPLAKTGSLAIIPMVGIWLWSTRQMKNIA